MALLICTATRGELSALLPALFPKTDDIPEMQPMRGNLKHGEALFLCTGVGPINTALSMGLCAGLVHPTGSNHVPIDAILYAGLAGSFDLDLAPLRSICHITTEIWPEYGLNDGATVTAAAFSHPLWQKPGRPPIYDRLALADMETLGLPKNRVPQWQSCKSLTVAGVTASFARRAALWNAWHAELENMEGFAAAYVAERADVPLVEIRVVSNKVGPRAKDEKDFPGALAALNQIPVALDLI